jgi:hypothetical protein
MAIVLALIFANNIFHFSQYRINKVFDRTSESMVVGRLARSAAEGIGARDAALGSSRNVKGDADSRDYDEQLRYFEHPGLIAAEGAEWDPYLSQLGLQGIFYALIDAVNPLPRHYRISLYHFLSALICAGALMWIASMIGERFGRAAMLGFVISIGFEPMFTALAPNLYWMVGIWFVPMAFAMRIVEAGDRPCRRLLIAAVGGAVFVKALCGYEFITTVIVAAMTGCLLNTKEERFYDNVVDMLRVFLASIAGFVLAVLVHGSKFTFASIIERALDRTTVAASSLEQGLILGQFASVASVLRTYFGANDYTQIRNFGAVFGLIGAIAVVAFFDQKYSWFLGPDRRRLRSLAIAYVVSFAAPLSWFVLAKGHAFVHPFLDFIIWYLPTMPIGGALVGLAISDIVTNRNEWRVSPARSFLSLSVPSAVVLLFALIAILDRNVDAKGAWILEAHVGGASIFADKDIGVDVRISENWFTVEYVCDRVSPADTFVIRAANGGSVVDYGFRLKDRAVFASAKGKCYYAQPKPPLARTRAEIGLESNRGSVWRREVVL